eukprot:scaffold2180_cov363-Prasinococcus_capsulatus_cf.AAC.2
MNTVSAGATHIDDYSVLAGQSIPSSQRRGSSALYNVCGRACGEAHCWVRHTLPERNWRMSDGARIH